MKSNEYNYKFCTIFFGGGVVKFIYIYIYDDGANVRGGI